MHELKCATKEIKDLVFNPNISKLHHSQRMRMKSQV